MRERRSFRDDSSTHPSYPTTSAPASQGPYGEAYPAYDYPPSSMAPSGSDYHMPQHHSAPSSAYAPTHPRSRSSSAEEAPVVAPLQTTFVLPPSYNTGSVSPTAAFHNHNQASQAPNLPSLTSSFFPPPSAAHTTIYRDRFSLPSSSRNNSSSYEASRSAHGSFAAPGGLVGGVETWGDQPLPSPSIDGYGSHDYLSAAPTPVLTSAPLTRQNSSTKGKGKAAKNAANAPRKRVPASCKPCRAKKLRCNRSLPCSSCVERGDPEGCIWEGDATPLYTLRDDNDTKDLKAQVDRLQHLLDALSQQTSPIPSGSGREVPVVAAAASSRSRPAKRNSGPFDPVLEDEDQPAEEVSFDLLANDISMALSELALNGVMPPQPSGSEAFAPGGGSGEAFVDEARQFLMTFTHRLGLASEAPFTVLTPSGAERTPESFGGSPHSHLASAASSPSRISSPSALGLSAALLNVRPTISHIIDLLPSEPELQSAYKFYVSYVHWYSSPLNLPVIERQWPAFRAALAEEDPAKRDADLDPLFVATVLGACASGLASMTNKQAKARGFPEDRSALVERWTQAAVLSLVVGRFMEEPTVEGVRAALVLSSLYIEQFMTTGETISAGMSLLSLAVHAAFQLQLHRDPVQKGKTTFAFHDCEDRRRLFWCLFTLCMSITTGTSRTYSQFDLRQIDCKFPLDCYDAELYMDERAAKARIRGRLHAEQYEETPLTASVVRAQLSLLVKKITDTAFGVKPCKYSEILALDGELRAFEKSFPSIYNLPQDETGRICFGVPPSLTEMRCALIQLCLSAEYVRLHRPFLVLAANDDQYQHSREQCVKYAKRMLAINATPGCKLNWAGHNFEVLSAAVVLGIELLQSPHEPDADVIRSMVDSAVRQAEGFAAVSSVCRKGSGVVRFLLAKVDEDAATATQPRRAKRARTGIYNPDDVKPSRRSLSDALGATGLPSAASSRTNSPDRSSRRRKPVRPALMHVQSDTVVAQVHTAASFAPLETAGERRGSRSHSADGAFPTLGSLAQDAQSLSSSAPQQVHEPVMLNPPPGSASTFSLSGRPIAGSAYRRGRTPSNQSGGSGFAQHLSSPELGLPIPVAAPGALQLPPLHAPSQQQQQQQQGSADAFMTFADVATSGAGHPPLSSSSLFDEHDVQSFFSLPSQVANASGGSDDDAQTPRMGDGVQGGGGKPHRSRFNVPLEEDGYQYRQH
ncbi:hypothetical protein JCM8097_005628 [Rhodosporidiobolus ruineniae]